MLITLSAVISMVWLVVIAIKLIPAHEKIRTRSGK